MYVDKDKFVKVIETAKDVALKMQTDGDAESLTDQAFLEGVIYANDFMLNVLTKDMKIIDEEGVKDFDVL